MFALLLLLAGGAIAAGVALSRKHAPAQVSAAMADKMNRYTTVAPSGERVFLPDVALSIVRTLASQLYTYVHPDDPTSVRIKPDPSGAPISPSLSALGWARLENRALTIMAPVYMAESSSVDRFLRALPPGEENFDGGALYAVLMYAGGFQKQSLPPGRPPKPGDVPPPTPTPTPVGAAQQEIPPDLFQVFEDLLAKGTDPAVLRQTADELDALGMHNSADLLRKRAADLEAGGVVKVTVPSPLPPLPSGTPRGWVLPVRDVQARLVQLGFLSGSQEVDGVAGPKTDGAVRAFQRQSGLKPDGIVGPKTATALLNPAAQPSQGPPVERAPVRHPASGDSLAPHSKWTVRSIQKMLAALGMLDPAGVDGVWGPHTAGAVKQFQASQGLVTDGIVGPKTWKALNLAVGASGTPTFEEPTLESMAKPEAPQS